MPVYYDNKSIIPAPFVSFNKIYNKNENGRVIGTTWDIIVKHRMLAYKGSPNSSGVFWTVSGYPPDEEIDPDSRLAAILRKQEALRELFSVHGKTFEIQPYDGSPVLAFNPRINKITIPEGKWFDYFDYEIQMEADVIYMNGTAVGEDEEINEYKISKSSENWHIEIADEKTKTYRLTHNIGAIGKLFYDDNGSITQEAWENARDYVLNAITLGIDTSKMIAPDVLDLDDHQAFNYIRGQTVNEGAGSFDVIETWLCFDPNTTPDAYGTGIAAIEEFNVNTRISAEDLRVNVSLEGNITGLEERDNTTNVLIASRATNALAKYAAVSTYFTTRAQNYSGYTMNPIPLNIQYTRNDITGIITYSVQFNNRAAATTVGAISEIITLVDNDASDVVGILPIPGRAAGPILQYMSTITEKRRDINIEIVMPAATVDFTYTAPNTDAIVAALTPSASQVSVTKDVPSWTPWTGRYSRQVSFLYQ